MWGEGVGVGDCAGDSEPDLSLFGCQLFHGLRQQLIDPAPNNLNTNGQQDEGEQTHQHIDAVFAKGKLNF